MNNKTTYSLNYRNSDDCIIRHTTTADIPRLKEIFAIARRFMAEAGNPNQWTEGYPSEELLQEDIDRQTATKENESITNFLEN